VAVNTTGELLADARGVTASSNAAIVLGTGAPDPAGGVARRFVY